MNLFYIFISLSSTSLNKKIDINSGLDQRPMITQNYTNAEKLYTFAKNLHKLKTLQYLEDPTISTINKMKVAQETFPPSYLIQLKKGGLFDDFLGEIE